MNITDRLDMAMDIAEGLKASSTLSGNTIYDLCLHISKAQEQLKDHGVIGDVSFCDCPVHGDVTWKNGFYECNKCDGLIRVIER